MDTVKLAALLAAAELGSISKAAEALGYTQSGVTHIINSLEEEAGFPLLVRGNRGVRFTAEGERLAPFIREVVQAAATLAQEAALTRGLERGTVRVGTYSSISRPVFPWSMSDFKPGDKDHFQSARGAWGCCAFCRSGAFRCPGWPLGQLGF